MPGDPPQQSGKAPYPARGVHIQSHGPTIVFLNLCTEDRAKLLANDLVHSLLLQVWQDSPAWLIGSYLIMPDHIHIFACPHDTSIKFDDWVTYWKGQFSLRHKYSKIRWQSKPFHHRLRTQESYLEKLDYVRQNPVHAGLVQDSKDWPYQGTLNHLRWH
ncbi:protein of unknown function DUF1568 [Pedosphaera parvula Ellin514]|uniref:Transposase IS200-like domain-containing protein n=1 Tax=Pedosphaera parvula (strain Ellin514) TaxID=320771 RepID=B9XH53_PEDPL|nr:protein of unknown function DUF1568 [Pedosphaera parvula Ellin514]